MKRRLLVWLMILCLLPVHFSAADGSTRPGLSPSEEPAVVGTDAWEPPVIDTEDALLVCDKNSTGDIKKLLEKLKASGLTEYL